MSMFQHEQHFWNAVFFIGFVPVFLICSAILWSIYGEFPRSIPLFDFFLLSLATYRLIRLFCYDKITLFIREYFTTFARGPGKTIAHLLDCPWCIGVWFGLALSFIYYTFTIGWFFLLLVAVSGLASFIQILVNMIGWYAERTKLEVRMMDMKLAEVAMEVRHVQKPEPRRRAPAHKPVPAQTLEEPEA